MKKPTAMHAVTEGQDTLTRKLRVPPAGLGVGWTVQFVPSKCSASVFTADPPAPTPPTAVHAFFPLQSTPFRELSDALGIVPGCDQDLPFQVSVKVLKTLPLSSSP